jgi:type II secretory pathway pseudopilin PulG
LPFIPDLLSKAPLSEDGLPPCWPLITEQGSFQVTVIAIMGLLASMLLPALSKAKESAQSIACLINIEQIGLASNIYSDDHDGHVPTFRIWLYRRSGGLTTYSLYPYLNSESVYISATDKIELA